MFLRPQTSSDGTYLGEKVLSSMTVLHLLQEQLKIAFGAQNFGDWELISTALKVKKMTFECNTLGVPEKSSSIDKFLSLFLGGSKLSPSYSLILAVKRLMTPSVWIRKPALGADGRDTDCRGQIYVWREFRRNVFNSALSETFLMYQLSLTTAQLQKLEFSKKM